MTQTVTATPAAPGHTVPPLVLLGNVGADRLTVAAVLVLVLALSICIDLLRHV